MYRSPYTENWREPSLAKALQNKAFISVEYEIGSSMEDVVNRIAALPSPYIILWYIGAYGLKQEGVLFYKESLITPIFKQNNKAQFGLLDLTAWGALRDTSIPITQFNSCVDKIDSFHPNIQCLKSSHILQEAQNMKDPILIDYLGEALQRQFILQHSENKPSSNISIRKVFNNGSPLFEKLDDMDAAQAYSSLQYLEALLLVEAVVKKQILSQEIDVVFALPNDELKYYSDDSNSFEIDLNFFLSRRLGIHLNGKRIHVYFRSFPYSTSLEYRPYNAPGRTLKKNTISLSHIINPDELV
jgi:hypothetical protein